MSTTALSLYLLSCVRFLAILELLRYADVSRIPAIISYWALCSLNDAIAARKTLRGESPSSLNSIISNRQFVPRFVRNVTSPHPTLSNTIYENLSLLCEFNQASVKMKHRVVVPFYHLRKTPLGAVLRFPFAWDGV